MKWVIAPKDAKGKEKEKKSFKYVLFFGTKDHAWIKEIYLSPYDAKYAENSVTQDKRLKKAIEAVEKYKKELAMDIKYGKSSDENLKENIRQNTLVFSSDKVIAEAQNEKSPKLKREREEEDSTQSSLARKKLKMSPSQDVRKEPQRTRKPGGNKADLQENTSGENSALSGKTAKKSEIAVSTKDMIAAKNPKTPKASKADLEEGTSGENSALSRKTAKKSQVAVSTKNSKKAAKNAKTPKAGNKTEMEKGSSKSKSAQPGKASVNPKKTAKGLVEEKERSPATQVIVKKSKIIYMPPAGSSRVYPGPSTSYNVPEIANGQIVYHVETPRISFFRPPNPLVLGFVGIGELAYNLVSELVKIGMNVLIWNRTRSKCAELVKRGAILAKTPADIAEVSDIVFCTVRGTGPITEVCIGGLYVGLDGILTGLKKNTKEEKGFVMLSSIKPITSLIIAEDFHNLNTHYLEAQAILNSRSKQCDIRVICAGDQELFEKLPGCFATTKAQFIFLSEMLGEASRMKYAYTVTQVTYILSIIEALAILKESDNSEDKLCFILDELDNVSPVMRNRVKDIIFRRRDLGGTIRELKDTLKELYEWYPRKQLPLATASYQALDWASRKGADHHNMHAMYRLLV